MVDCRSRLSRDVYHTFEVPGSIVMSWCTAVYHTASYQVGKKLHPQPRHGDARQFPICGEKSDDEGLKKKSC